MSNRFPLSIVVLTLNRPTLLKACMQSIFRFTSTPFELILLDNGSTMPEVFEYIDQVKNDHPEQVRVVKSDTNLGCGIGRAQALDAARGKTLCTIDSDICVTPQWDRMLLERLYEDDDIAATGAKIVNPDNHLFSNGGSASLIGSGFVHLENIDFRKSLFDSDVSGRLDCDWIPAGAMMMRRSAYEQSPYSHRRYKNCLVEINVAFKMRRNGWRLVNCPEAVAYHYSEMLETGQKEAYFAVRRNTAVFCQSILYFEDDFGVNPVTSWGCPSQFLRMANPTLLELHEVFQEMREYLNGTRGVTKAEDGVLLYDLNGISAFLAERGIG